MSIRRSDGIIPSYKQGWATHGASQAPNLWKEVVGAWAPFLGPTGSRLLDWSGNHNDGTLTPATDWAVRKDGWVLEFDGTGNTFVEIPHNSSFDFGVNSFSVGAWVKINAATSVLVNKYDSSPIVGFNLEIDGSGQPQFVILDGLGGVDLAKWDVNIVDGNWHFVVGVKTGISRIDLFVDGQLRASDSAISQTSSITSNDPLKIGIRVDTPIGPMNGLIDSVFILKRAPSAAEIMQRYLNPYAMFEVPISPAIFGAESVVELAAMIKSLGWNPVQINPGVNR